MPVGTPLELYTVVLAWHIYTATWDLLSNLGLTLIPFASIIFNNLIEARKGAAKTDVGVQALRRTEVEGLVAIFVMLLFAVPNVALKARTVTYIHSSCSIQNNALERTTEKRTFGVTRTTFDE